MRTTPVTHRSQRAKLMFARALTVRHSPLLGVLDSAWESTHPCIVLEKGFVKEATAAGSRQTADSWKARAARVCALVDHGALSRASQTLSSGKQAPGNKEALQKLPDPARRPTAPLEPLPQEVVDFASRAPLQVDKRLFHETLRTAPRGSAAATTGLTFEHPKTLLDDEEALNWLFLVA